VFPFPSSPIGSWIPASWAASLMSLEMCEGLICLDWWVRKRYGESLAWGERAARRLFIQSFISSSKLEL